jgi:DNA mismatch repair protein MutL
MSVIRILTEKVASQIAAGEVVDRPASVVKELMENSIDAEADRIAVRIESGGKSLVRVSDNGVGMSRDDVLLCVERHATSKINRAEDLYSVASLGFRGEALPSIASVSRLEVATRPKDQVAGHRLRISGGKFIGIEEAGTPPGTSVEVRNLFFNIPARRKFLRAAKTETDHIVDVFTRAALPFLEVGFRLDDAQGPLLNLPIARDYLARLTALMGRNVAESMTEGFQEDGQLTIRAYLGSGTMTRSRADRLFVYVNGRNIRDRMLNKAVISGYGQRLMKGQYPQAVLFLEIDPSQVDVNVHPMKQEVKFRDTQGVFQRVTQTIEQSMPRPSFGFSAQGPQSKWEPAPFRDGGGFLSEPSGEYAGAREDLKPETRAMVEPGPRIIGQLKNTYILCEVDDGLLIVDQHAAHERIVYENLKEGFRSSQIESQALLVPLRLEMSATETPVIQDKEGELQRLGMELDHFGGNTFLLRSHPALLKDVEWESFVSELAKELKTGRVEDETILDRALTVMACHGAVRAGHRLTQDEMVHLLRQLEDTDTPTHCPHGRPITRHFGPREIDKMFKRIL